MMKITIVLAASLALFTFLNIDAATAQEEKTVNIETILNDIGKFEAEINKARKEQLNVLSPGWFARAEASFDKAKSGAEKGVAIKKIHENMLTARENLEKAQETAKLSRTMLPQVIEIRNKAHLAGAAKLSEEYDQAEKQFVRLTEAIEKNNIKYAQDNALKVQKVYQDLELLAIKNETIGKVREAVSMAEEDKAEKYSPRAFETAQRHLAETDEFISNNRYAKDEMQDRAEEALFYANRARALTGQSKKFEAISPEESSLWVEDVLSKITTWLSAKDARDQDMEGQLENIMGSILALKDDHNRVSKELASTKKELKETRQSYEARIETLNQTLAASENKALQAQKAKESLLADQKVKESELLKAKALVQAEQKAIAQKLADERQFNQKYIEIQNFFSTEEAEVYKRGNQLIVRLKGMQFPVGQAIILPENYQLLSKVQRAIGSFENPSVVIEGHTDSTGSKEMNDDLSQRRADAVKDYLIANKTLSENKIVAQGYGPDKPVSSNATAEGRAANRRIDVIVTPALMPGK